MFSLVFVSERDGGSYEKSGKPVASVCIHPSQEELHTVEGVERHNQVVKQQWLK